MSRYIPMPAYPDMMPVDISFVFENEKPAGKHGFVKADGEVLRFEDGTLARFWGVNFNGGACFPSKEYARTVTQRLAQSGCNIVRFHQLDAEWDTPNLFSFTKGKRVTTTRKLDEQSLDRLDYLIYCLKEAGIYCYLDNMTYRKFKEEDGVPFHKDLLDSAKPWSITNPRLIELQKEFCMQLWNHFNPYTGLAYKDDPVFALTEITNECDLFINSTGRKVDFVPIPYYENEFRELFRDWLEKQGIDYDWENCDLYVKDEPMLQFKIYITQKYNEEMRDYLRSEVGLKIPITGTNWAHGPGVAKSHVNASYIDYVENQLVLKTYLIQGRSNSMTLAGYNSWEEAMADTTEGVTYYALAANVDGGTISKDIILDLAGNSLTNVTVAEGVTVYGMDTTTDDFDCTDGYGTISGTVNGTIATNIKTTAAQTGSVKRYLAVTEEGVTSFHRFYMGITYMTIRPGVTGVGYKAQFSGDSVIQEQVTSYGYKLWVGDGSKYTASKTELVSSNTVTLCVKNFDVEGYGEADINASVFMQFANGVAVETNTYSSSLRTLLETINNSVSDFDDDKMTALQTLCETYADAMKDWSIDAIRSWTAAEEA